MRGDDRKQGHMWSYLSPEARVPKDHPLRPIRAMVDQALGELDPLFRRLYSRIGRPSIAPEMLLRALVLQILYSIRSERLLMEHLDADLRFRWFVGLSADDPVWDVTVFTKNRDRLLRGDVAGAFFAAVIAQAGAADLLSDEHFSVDGTLIEAWAGQKSFRPKDERPGSHSGAGGEADFKGKRRTNDTHESTTDADARLYRKGNGQEARLCYLGHVVIENRSGLAVGGTLTGATGTAERDAALALADAVPRARRASLGADRGYDTHDFVAELRARGITPHVAQHTTKRRSAIDRRTTRHPGYAMSIHARRFIERVFGWGKTTGPWRKTHFRGRDRVGMGFLLGLAVYDLVRLRTLLVAKAA